ncbi:MAG: hypothetical protein BAA01_05195 [Bacillus thermozeamaize]|uniref:Crp/Fnr family transcriptional regulator n=1 Tax=Bacillus thermozeamaize TaxID=230954 RepID=A0A1Y3PME0_9BACI|nr:MAG: hypothetical protein BAA01_05195 [Bacillus thermozeamaize]
MHVLLSRHNISSSSQIRSYFSEENLNLLIENMYLKKLGTGSYLFMEGDPSDRLFYVYQGKIKITKQTPGGKEFILYFLQDGDIYGEIGDKNEVQHNCSAYVMEDSVVGILQQSDLEILLYRHGDLATQFVKWMGMMNRKTQSKFRDLLLYGKPGALCSTLIRLTNTCGVEIEEGILISLRLTHSELANMIGTTRESVNRILNDLKSQDVIGYHDGSIVVKDLDYLRNICHCGDCPAEICRI